MDVDGSQEFGVFIGVQKRVYVMDLGKSYIEGEVFIFFF